MLLVAEDACLLTFEKCECKAECRPTPHKAEDFAQGGDLRTASNWTLRSKSADKDFPDYFLYTASYQSFVLYPSLPTDLRPLYVSASSDFCAVVKGR